MDEEEGPIASSPTKPLQQRIRMTVSASNFRRFEREQLRALCDLALQPTGHGLHDRAIFERDGVHSVGLSTRPQLDRNIQVLPSPKTGKPRYSAAVPIPDAEARQQFEVEALAAIAQLFPLALR